MLPLPESPRMNLKLLWWLRTVAIAGQSAAIAFAAWGLKLRLPVWPLCCIILLLAALNLATLVRLRNPAPVTQREFFLQLLADMTALAFLLYFAGGAGNPFTSLFILQVVIAAIALKPGYSWMAAGLAIGYYTLLLAFQNDLPVPAHHHAAGGREGDGFGLHVLGMWVNFILLALLVAWFVARMAATLRAQDRRLAEAEQLALLGTFAAQAAHDLGTPLATLALLAGEYGEEAQNPAQQARAKMFSREIARCKAQISRITAMAGVMRAESGKPMPLEDWLDALSSLLRQARPRTDCRLKITGDCIIRAGIGLEEAVMNLLTNAADASPKTVELHACVSPRTLELEVRDNGPGLAQALIRSLGEPGVTTKESGLGMGLFLSRTVITRLGGRLEAGLLAAGGTSMRVILPLAQVTA